MSNFKYEVQELLGDKIYLLVTYKGETVVCSWHELYVIFRNDPRLVYLKGDLEDFVKEWLEENNVKVMPLSRPTAEDVNEIAKNMKERYPKYR